jgi:competence protein ComEC
MQKPVKYYWKEMPFARLLVPFMIGILYPLYNAKFLQFLMPLFLLAIFLLWLIHRLPAWKAWKWGFLRGILINLLIFLAGACIVVCLNKLQFRDTCKVNMDAGKNHWLVVMAEPAMKKNGRFRATVLLFEILPGAKKRNRGKAILYFPRENQDLRLHYGSALAIKAKVNPFVKKTNPGQFDYTSYYLHQGIYYQVFLQEGEYIPVPIKSSGYFKKYLFGLRNKILKILQTHIRHKEAAGLAEALLIGYRNDLDQSLLTAYANTGVVHVIAISGLHLGLLFAVMMTLTGFWNRNRKKKWIQFILVIPVLWIFSLMAGGSASVIRSACMFTFFGIGQLFEKKSNPLNTLGAAAFVLLAYQPYWMLDTGFQLSFAAVASIMVYYERIRQIFFFRNPVAIKCWEMIAVTISAQILTTPLILFYFKQFPLLFLFTNLVAVPLSGWILLGELLLCFCYPFNFISRKLGHFLENAIILLNTYVLKMESVPYSVIHDVYISTGQVLALYICIGSLTTWIFVKQKKAWLFLLSGIFIYSSLQLQEQIARNNQQKLLVMDIRGQQTILLINGKSATLFSKITTPGQTNVQDKEMALVKQFFRIKHIASKILPNSGITRIKQAGKTILLFTGETGFDSYNELPRAYMGILSLNTGINLEKLNQQTGCRILVADGTNSLWKIQEWKKQAEQLHLRFHSVNVSGAFIADF